jgi:hypothetical protein
MPTEGVRFQNILSFRDGIALIVAITLGVGFAYLSTLAGFAWLVVAGPYTVLIIPSIVIFLADQRKLLVWQACVLSFILYVRANFPGMGKRDTLKMAFVFWAIGTVFSAPAPAYFYLRRFQGRMRYIVAAAIAVFAAALWLLVKRITG